MKLGIVGSRNFSDYKRFQELLRASIDLTQVTMIVSGGAKGVDSMARRFAKQEKLPIKEFLPDYARHKRGAPLKRNSQIVEFSDKVIAFPTKTSSGTYDSIRKAKIKNNLHSVIYV